MTASATGTTSPLRLAVLAAVAVGGAAGALARYGLTHVVPDGGGFPWTTFAVNVAGSLLLAMLPASAAVRRHPLLPPALGTGVLGGFTTMSAYAEQARALLAAGQTGTAAAYVLGTLAAALVAVALVDRFVLLPARVEFEAEEGDL